MDERQRWEGETICSMDGIGAWVLLLACQAGAEWELTAQLCSPEIWLCKHESLQPVVLREIAFSYAWVPRSPCSKPLPNRAVYVCCRTYHPDTTVPDRVVSWEGRFLILLCTADNELSRISCVKERKTNQTHLLGSVFKYSFDFIHFFFPKVHNGEVNSPILLDTHLPGKQNTCMSGPVCTFTGRHKLTPPPSSFFFFLIFFFCKVQRGLK